MHGAIFVARSKNYKIGNVSCTFASIKATCPDTCSLKDSGCYAKNSFVGMINYRMDKRARQHSPLKLARAEANAIDNAYGGRTIPKNRMLRLHISGDSKTIKGTRLLAKAAKRYQDRNEGAIWTFTHAWKHVPR